MITSPEFQQAIDAEYERLVEHLATLGAEASRIEGYIEDLNRLRGDQLPAEALEADHEPEPPARPKPVAKKASAAKPSSKPSGKATGKAPRKNDTQARILEALRNEGGPLSGTDLVRLLDSSASTVSNALKALGERRAVEPAGMDGIRKLWRLKTHQVAGAVPAAKPAKQPTAADGRQEPKLEGKILGLLQVQSLPPREIAEMLGADFSEVQTAISELNRRGDLKYEGNGWMAVL